MDRWDISVPDTIRDWIRTRVEAGGYASVSDYVGDLIRRDKSESDRQDALMAALTEGEDSGVSARQVPEIWAAVKNELTSEKG